MKALTLKTLFTALGFFILSATFAQVGQTPSDSAATTQNDVQSGTVSTDSSMSSSSAGTMTQDSSHMNHSTMDQNATGTSDANAMAEKEAKRLKKAAKKEGKLAKKPSESGTTEN